MSFKIVKCYKGFDLFIGNKHLGTYKTVSEAESAAIEY